MNVSSTPRRQRCISGSALAACAVLPYLLYVGAIVAVPAVTIMVEAFTGPGGHPTMGNVSAALTGQYAMSLRESLILSAASTAVAGVAGTVVALAVNSAHSPAVRRLAVTASSVFASSGGVSLAFAFVAILGSSGLLTEALAHTGLNLYDHGFSLYSTFGLLIVYQFFLLPLAVLLMLPPIQEFRPEWREASLILGAGPVTLWRHTVFPILRPQFAAAMLVLFCQAFTSYAAASALTNGVIPLVPIQIGALLDGDATAGQANLGSALGLEMIAVMAAAGAGYAFTQRQAHRRAAS